MACRCRQTNRAVRVAALSTRLIERAGFAHVSSSEATGTIAQLRKPLREAQDLGVEQQSAGEEITHTYQQM
jgi:hypothetical protein